MTPSSLQRYSGRINARLVVGKLDIVNSALADSICASFTSRMTPKFSLAPGNETDDAESKSRALSVLLSPFRAGDSETLVLSSSCLFPLLVMFFKQSRSSATSTDASSLSARRTFTSVDLRSWASLRLRRCENRPRWLRFLPPEPSLLMIFLWLPTSVDSSLCFKVCSRCSTSLSQP